eukprot:s828_g26.t1
MQFFFYKGSADKKDHEFRSAATQGYSTGAQAQLAYLKPFQIALLASSAAHFRLREPKLLVRLGQSVGSNLDSFSMQQVGIVAEAFDVVGHHHRKLVGYIEQILLKAQEEGAEARPGDAASRRRLIAALLTAAAQQESFARRSQATMQLFAEELTNELKASAPFEDAVPRQETCNKPEQAAMIGAFSYLVSFDK